MLPKIDDEDTCVSTHTRGYDVRGSRPRTPSLVSRDGHPLQLCPFRDVLVGHPSGHIANEMPYMDLNSFRMYNIQ